MKFDLKKLALLFVLVIASIFICVKILNKESDISEFKSSSVDMDISGIWNFKLSGDEPSADKTEHVVTIQQTKNSLLGTFVPQVPRSPQTESIESWEKSVRGDMKKGELNFMFFLNSTPILKFEGKVSTSGKELDGEWRFNSGLGFQNQIGKHWHAIKIS